VEVSGEARHPKYALAHYVKTAFTGCAEVVGAVTVGASLDDLPAS
jgi:hypothetical protein